MALPLNSFGRLFLYSLLPDTSPFDARTDVRSVVPSGDSDAYGNERWDSCAVDIVPILRNEPLPLTCCIFDPRLLGAVSVNFDDLTNRLTNIAKNKYNYQNYKIIDLTDEYVIIQLVADGALPEL